jgi:hypothetical protein
MTVKCKLQKETEDEGLGVLEPEGDEDKREGELQMKARGQQKRQTREGRIMKTRMRSQSNRKVRHSHERLTQRHIKFMWFWSQSEFISDFNKHTSHLHFWMNFSSNENRLFLILVKSFR